MKIKNLITELQKLDPNLEVILQKDSEGNGYSPLYGIDYEAIYIPESTWGGNVYDPHWTAEDAGMEEVEWQKILKKKRCVILSPTN